MIRIIDPKPNPLEETLLSKFFPVLQISSFSINPLQIAWKMYFASQVPYQSNF